MLIRYRSSFTLAAHPETGPLASAVKLFYTRRYTRRYLLLAIVICLCNGLYWFPLCTGLLQGYQPASDVAGLLGPFKQLLWQDGGCASFSWLVCCHHLCLMSGHAARDSSQKPFTLVSYDHCLFATPLYSYHIPQVESYHDMLCF